MMGDMPARYDVIGLDADDTLWHSEDTFHQVEARFVELVSPYASIGVDVAAALRATERAQLPIAGYGVKAFTLSMVQAAITVSEGRVPALVIGQLLELGMDMLTETVRLLPDVPAVLEVLGGLQPQNAQGEYYLTDLVGIYRRRKLPVETVMVAHADEIRGINSRTELAEVSRIVRQNKNEELMAAGVTLVDPATTYIDPDVEIGPDTVIHPGVVIQGQTRIGDACEIQAHVRVVDSTIGARVAINSFCLIVGASVADGAAIGPFAHLRPESAVGEKAHVGNFVELKKTTLGAGSKANHHAYLGDATIGANVNIGAGTIVCNYDGQSKHRTSIEDDAFIGSDTQLIAPVTVGRGAYVGTGTTVRENVPPGALAVSAGKQRNLEGWVARKRGTGVKT